MTVETRRADPRTTRGGGLGAIRPSSRMSNGTRPESKQLANEPLLRVLTFRRDAIVGRAAEAIRETRTRYRTAGQPETVQRLDGLYLELLEAVSRRDLGRIVAYSRELAAQRFQSGYDLSDVQVAFNALEEAAWSCLCSELQPDELAAALGVVSTVLGAAKDALAREYVALASHTHVPSLDMRALFTGGAGA